MSTIDVSLDLPLARTLPAPRTSLPEGRADRRPWGFWGSLGWGLLAIASGLFAAVVYTIAWMLTHQLHAPNPANAVFANGVGIAASVVPLVVLVIAVKARQFSPADYFALDGLPLRDLFLGVGCLTVLIVGFSAMGSLLGVDVGSGSVEATYRAAKLAGALPLLWLGTVVVAPVTEELLFRGFLHYGWRSSWLGVSGTVVLTAALWAALHQQYNLIGILFIFLMGLIFGWMRQRSGSTTLTIVLHACNNLFAMAAVAIQVEWLS